jgi:hypothetical protein
VRQQDRPLEREHSIYGFHKQVNLVERTWNDDLHPMSHGLGIAIVAHPFLVGAPIAPRRVGGHVRFGSNSVIAAMSAA